MVIDFGALTQKNQDAFFRCSRCFLVGSVSGWQLADFAALAAEKQKWKKWCEYFVSFGEEEAVKMAEQYLDIRIRQNPTAEERIDGYGRVHDFFWKIPTISEADLGVINYRLSPKGQKLEGAVFAEWRRCGMVVRKVKKKRQRGGVGNSREYLSRDYSDIRVKESRF